MTSPSSPSAETGAAHEEEELTVVQFGEDKVVIGRGHADGKPALFIAAKEHGGHVSGGSIRALPLQGEIVLTFPTDSQAEAAYLALRLPARETASFQDRVQPWMMACFGAEISGDKMERGDRLLEEVLELLQSNDYDPARVSALRDYVWSRPAGEPFQEVGGVQVTLAAYCLAHALDMHEAGETELARIWTKVDKIRAKQAAKPVGSALPIALSSKAGETDELREAAETFANYCDEFNDWCPDETPAFYTGEDGHPSTLTVGDFRRIRMALNLEPKA